MIDSRGPVLSEYFDPILRRLGVREDWKAVLVEVRLVGRVRLHVDPRYDALDLLKRKLETVGDIESSGSHLF